MVIRIFQILATAPSTGHKTLKIGADLNEFCRRYYNDAVKLISPVVLAHSKYGKLNKDLEPIVIMHGLMGSKANWGSIAKVLNQQTSREVYCVDARNHGHSPHSPEMTYKHMAADLHKLIADQGLAPAVVVGHSMGGRAAMLLAITQPEDVNRLVVVDISPVRSSPQLAVMGTFFTALRNVKIKAGTPLSEARKVADEQLTETIEDSRIRQFLLMNLEVKGDVASFRVNLEALDANFEKEIAVFPSLPAGTVCHVPTLLIAGQDSDYVKSEDMPAIQKLFPRASLELVANAGHWVHADQPARFVETVTKYLQST